MISQIHSHSYFRPEIYKHNPDDYESENAEVPWPVSGHKILCDPSGNGLYLIGGWNRDHREMYDDDPNNFDLSYVRQVWKYNFTRKIWTKLRSDNSPIGLASHCCCWLSSNQILVYGGSLSTRGIAGNSNETYTYNTLNETWTLLPTAGQLCSEHCGHWFGQAACRAGDDLFSATGYTLRFSQGVHINRLDLHTLIWSQLTSNSDQSSGPGCRVRHDLVAFRDKLFVIGGGSDFREHCYTLTTLPCFDLRSNKWVEVETIPDAHSNSWPLPRLGQTCVQSGSKVYMCGGYSQLDNLDQGQPTGAVLDDLWVLDLATLRWTSFPNLSLPVPTWFHAADLTPDHSRMYVFGGCTDADYEIRSNALCSININAAESLESQCWREISSLFDHFDGFPVETIGPKLGISQKYVDRIRW